MVHARVFPALLRAFCRPSFCLLGSVERCTHFSSGPVYHHIFSVPPEDSSAAHSSLGSLMQQHDQLPKHSILGLNRRWSAGVRRFSPDHLVTSTLPSTGLDSQGSGWLQFPTSDPVLTECRLIDACATLVSRADGLSPTADFWPYELLAAFARSAV